MNRKIIMVAAAFGMLALAGVAAAVISSYGGITGAATVQPAIGWDIIETGSDVNSSATNDSHYQLETAHQGETKWVKIKIENAADIELPVNVSITGSTTDVAITIWNAEKSAELANPVAVPTSDTYIWLRHEIAADASPGSYVFEVDFAPV